MKPLLDSGDLLEGPINCFHMEPGATPRNIAHFRWLVQFSDVEASRGVISRTKQ